MAYYSTVTGRYEELIFPRGAPLVFQNHIFQKLKLIFLYAAGRQTKKEII